VSKADIGGGGGFVNMQKESYDMVLNVLLGIRRALADLSNVIPQKLDQHQYEKRLCMETDWMTTR